MQYYLSLFIWFAVVVYVFANGIYAMACPSRWLQARWTAKGQFRRDASYGAIRLLALLFFVAAAAFADGAYRMFSSIFCLR
jgi:hypothetical protein